MSSSGGDAAPRFDVIAITTIAKADVAIRASGAASWRATRTAIAARTAPPKSATKTEAMALSAAPVSLSRNIATHAAAIVVQIRPAQAFPRVLAERFSKALHDGHRTMKANPTKPSSTSKTL